MSSFKIKKKLKTARKIKEENDEGNIEYKWKICDFQDLSRKEKLISQMRYRLNEGDGKAIYNIGYTDNGNPTGIVYTKLMESLMNFQDICNKAEATIKSIKIFRSKNKMQLTYCANIFIERSTELDTFYMITSDDLF